MTPYPFTSSDLVFSTRQDRVRLATRSDLIPLIHSVSIPESALDLNKGSWFIRRQIQIARAMAVVADRSLVEGCVLTMGAALQIRGLPTWMNADTIRYRTLDSTGTTTRRNAGKVRVGSTHVPEVPILRVRGKRLGNQTELVRGTPAVTLQETCLDLARFEYPLTAYVGVSVALSAMCQFDVFELESSRARERSIKSHLLSLLNDSDCSPYNRRARAIIIAADTGIETPPEGLLLWLIHVMLRKDSRPAARFESQYPVNVGERNYRVDIGFPQLKLYGEFDGRSKLINNHSAAGDWIARQRALHSAGWDPIRFTTEDLRDIPSVARDLSHELKSMGLHVSAPGGALWMPVPREHMVSTRRN